MSASIIFTASNILDEHLRSMPPDNSIASRVSMAVFGQRRYVFKWPLLALGVLLLRRIVVAVLNRRRGTSSRR